MSSLSSLDLETGRSLIELFSRTNPTLIPKELGFFVPAYKKFVLTPSAYEGHGVMSTAESWLRILQSHGKHKKLIILASGISAGGKDALREEMQSISPESVHRVVTGTSRKIRTERGEVDGVDYYFFDSVVQFMAEVAALQFIEYVAQGEGEALRYYGLPKKSLDAALDQEKPLIWCQVEITAWETVQNHLQETGHTDVAVVKLFVLPAMKFDQYQQHLGKHRNDDIEGRLVRTGWEVTEAPVRSDLIISNVFSEDLAALKLNARVLMEELGKIVGINSF